ncbi:MAG: Pyruvate carboxyltransferase protein [Deltaproteobacteria bacterium]|nr:Pyruvate carboxyltransferase protein [Deltaproteobacteria bacterium]
MSEISFIDTTLRDGQQSLWALGMKTDAMLGAAAEMDRIGFESMEFFVSIMIKKYVRELKENPWTWLREGTKLFRRTRLRNHGGLHGSGAMEKLPQSALKLLAERVVSYGIALTRTSNCWNDFDELRREVIDLRELGMETVVNLIYTVSPRHSDDYYAQKTREAAAIGPYRICFKDVGGLLTPERARTLIPAIMQNAGKVPVEYHAHCNNGLAPLCYLEAIKHGITSLHTAIPPLANGSSQPSILNVAKNLRALGHTPMVDEKAVEPVAKHFTAIAKRDGLAIGKPFAYDQSQYLHQVPGGVISNLRHQLKLVGKENQLPETLEETARVRADFGYPIMVTPLSQFVVSQAAINVIVGERYKEVTDQVIQYALGFWGKEAPALLDADTKDKILSRRRAKDWQNWTPPDLSLHQVRQKLGATISDEELLLRVYAGPDAVAALMSNGAPKAKLDAKQPLLNLIEELTKKKNCSHIYIRRDGVSLTLGRAAENKLAAATKSN